MTCTCGPAVMGMKRYHLFLIVASILIAHFVTVQLAKAGYVKVSSVGKVSTK